MSTHNIGFYGEINNFAYFSITTYVVGTHRIASPRLAEAILMSTHKIGFYGEIRKIIP